MDEADRILANREDLYRFLGRLYRSEVDAPLWEAIRKMSFPDSTGNASLDQGYGLMRKYLAAPGDDPLTDLAVDYARIFLAAGIYEGDAAFPIESVYTSKDHLVMQEAWEKVAKAYGEKGVAKKDKDLPEDHLGLELEFMARLVAEERAARAKAGGAAAEKASGEQKKFLAEHLAPWVGAFCADVRKCPGGDFYKAVSYLTEGFLQIEEELLGLRA